MLKEATLTTAPHTAPARRSATAGFTMLELLIVIAVIGLVSTLLVPNLLWELEKQRIRNHITETTSFFLIVKQEAVRRSAPVVVTIDLDEDRLFAFANVDGDADLEFNPDATALNRTADYEVARLDLPTAGDTLFMDFYGPTDGAARGATMIDGLSTNGDGEPVVVFEPDGSIRNIGAIRLADFKVNNFFEVRIAPAATARIRVLKYNSSSDFGGPNFLPSGQDPATGSSYWTWK